MKIFSAIRLILTLNCEQSAKLYCDGFERKLSPTERIAVVCHHAVCRSSRELAKQLKAMEKTLRRHPDAIAAAELQMNQELTLSAGAKDRMRQTLSKLVDADEDDLGNSIESESNPRS